MNNLPTNFWLHKQSAICKQRGFTLIELIIALALGMVITAAVLQVYYMNVKTKTVQDSGSKFQDVSVFGIQDMDRTIRLANLGNPVRQITDKTLLGGVVLTANNANVAAGYLSRYAGDTAVGDNTWTGISNFDIDSDQLTVQYKNVTGEDRVDCESSVVAVDDIVIERYFLRESTEATATGDVKNLVLACDAGRLDLQGNLLAFGASNSQNFGGSGTEYIVGVDQFKFLLGVQYPEQGATPQRMVYMPSAAYLDAVSGIAQEVDKPKIVAVKVGVIVHGETPIVGSGDQTEFDLLNQTHKLKTDTTRTKHVRNSFETTVMLRNARVVTIAP